MNIAILGLGTVGSGVFELVKNQESLHVGKVLVRSGKFPDWDKAVTDIHEIIHDPTIDCVVETLGGIQPAYAYICAALKNKKHVVTANKAVVAQHLPEFLALAKQAGVQFLFDASVAGGIPWLTNLAQIKQTNAIDSFHGILNGTSNFILDRMDRFHEDFETALRQAQALGYAEADPSADIDGYDVQNKMVLSNAVAFDAFTPVETVTTFPLRGITKTDIDYALLQQCQIRYIGQTIRKEKGFESTVFPTMIAKQTLAANTFENNNIVTLEGSAVGNLSFFGQGAGKFPTANAVVQDLLSIQSKGVQLLKIEQTLYPQDLSLYRYLIRAEKTLSHESLIQSETYQTYTYHYTSKIPLVGLKHLLNELPEDVLVIQINK